MIGYLTGKIISKKPTQVLLDVNGVGYLINISINTFEKLPADNLQVSLYTYLNVQENALTLYGFSALAEKEMFELLISISGIGPKLAQGVLSGIQIGELREAIKSANTSRIIAVPGVGKKTAERLIIELRDKVEAISIESDSGSSASYSVTRDAISALTSLGYNAKTAENAVRKALSKNPSSLIEDVVKNALAVLNS